MVAASIRLNEYHADDFTTESLQYHLCHQLGHVLGLFHEGTGCMTESIEVITGDMVYPDQTNFDELQDLYGRRRRRILQQRLRGSETAEEKE
jgi:hypothetical protein